MRESEASSFLLEHLVPSGQLVPLPPSTPLHTSPHTRPHPVPAALVSIRSAPPAVRSDCSFAVTLCYFDLCQSTVLTISPPSVRSAAVRAVSLLPQRSSCEPSSLVNLPPSFTASCVEVFSSVSLGCWFGL